MDFASQVVRLLALSSLPPLVSLVGFTIFGLLVWKVRRFGLRTQQVADAVGLPESVPLQRTATTLNQATAAMIALLVEEILGLG
jgi:hypothetical protein